MDKYVIFSLTETQNNPDLGPSFWSNIDGWGQMEDATVFTKREREFIDVILPRPDGQWVKLPSQQ